MDGIERGFRYDESGFRYARQELYSDSDSLQEKMVEIADSEISLVEWQNRTDTTENEAEEEENQPLPPVKMFFDSSQYHNAIKLGTRCYIHKAVAELESLDLEPDEVRWFREHPQFQHFWHTHRAMSEEKTHKMMGMWMPLLQTTKTNKKREAWFVVNGVLIRYSLTENAFLSGLNCLPYPEDYESIGSSSFKDTYFENTVPSLAAVEKQLESMRYRDHPDRLKICVAYFLSCIISGKTKTGKGAPSVDPLFLRMVDDLDACRTFPWGRYSFDVNMKEFEHTMRHFKGVIETDAWTFPSFVTPLELLAFEAIPCLKNKYMEDVRGADRSCPRMCRQKFQSFILSGFPLLDIYETLGNTREIKSILQPSEDEDIMLARIIERRIVEEDVDDIVLENWTRRLEWVLHDDAVAKKNVATEKAVPVDVVEQLKSLQKSIDAHEEAEAAEELKQPKQKTDQKEPEQKEPKPKEPEQKEPKQKKEHKEPEQKEAEPKEVDLKEAEDADPGEADVADAVNEEVGEKGENLEKGMGLGKRRQEQSKAGPSTRQRR
ncbi:uncharacterized protein At3g43530-like [Eutrema salsugineum]|uniref:uncharacterized protein At3g43530-like n=1 Tax=Eutrema salsugineum TaxID=72664 RepID=UPI000CED7201|nr:uncharacterized protein At3g43530-like [Eutrema salsugineum]